MFLPAPALVVDEGTEWSMQPPVAEDNCSEVDVHIYSLVTNTLPDGSYDIDCIWEAVDACGNSTLMSHDIQVIAVVVPDPRLTIAPGDGLLAIQWPAEPAGWWLESTTRLVDPDWNPVAISPLLTNGLYSVKVAPTGPSQWFRLASGEPPLALSHVQPGMLMLTWPSLATGYAVERCEDLSAGIWTPDSATILVTNGLHCVEFEATGNTGFFRLVKPAP